MSVKQYKIAKSLVVSIGVLGFSSWLVTQGLPAREVFWPTLLLLALINGVELPELLAAYTEISDYDSSGSSENDSE